MQQPTHDRKSDKGFRASHIALLYICISAVLVIGVYNRWQASERQTQQFAAPATQVTTPVTALTTTESNTTHTPELADIDIALTDEEVIEQLRKLEEEYEALLDERDRLARVISPEDMEFSESTKRQIDWLNAIPKEERTSEFDSALIKFAMGLIPLSDSFEIRPDDWQFNEEQEFFDAFYAEFGFDDAGLQQYFNNFTCTSSTCDLQFNELPDDLYSKMRSDFFRVSNERLRHHPTLSISINSSPSTGVIRLSVGRRK